MSAWEPVSWRSPNGSVRDFFGVFASDGDAAEPIAIFSSREEADEWIEFMAAHPDADRIWGKAARNDVVVMQLRAEATDGDEAETLWCWNSIDDAPESGPGGES